MIIYLSLFSTLGETGGRLIPRCRGSQLIYDGFFLGASAPKPSDFGKVRVYLPANGKMGQTDRTDVLGAVNWVPPEDGQKNLWSLILKNN